MSVQVLFHVTVKKPRESGQKQVRAYLAWGVLELSSGNLTELGETINRDSSSLNSAVTRLKIRSVRDRYVEKVMTKLKGRIGQLVNLQACPLLT